MLLDDVMTTVRDTLTVRRVFGEPYEQDGITILPTATVNGGGGGGGGDDGQGQQGQGGGLGVAMKPAGVYVLADGHVRWRPAVDVNRLIGSVAAVAIVALLAHARLERLRITQECR